MKWEDFQSSQNVEDRRGGDQYADAGGGGSRIGAGHLGLGTVVILGLIGYMTGINPAVLIGGAEMLNNMRGGGQVTAPRQSQRGDDRPADRPDGPIRRQDSRRKRRSLVAGSAGAKEHRVPAAETGHVRRPNRVGLRRGAIGDGAVLLPDRP